MKRNIITLIFCFTILNAFTQNKSNDTPTHLVKAAEYIHSSEIEAYIDSSLFARYLDWNLQSDSLPSGILRENNFEITMMYVVSKEGKISEVKTRESNNGELGIFIRQKLLACPYRWFPAYRNGRAVNSYHLLKIKFNGS